MAQELPTPTRDEFGPLEPDEIEARAEELAEEREMERLRGDKKFNYATLRNLKPITDGKGLGAMNFDSILVDDILGYFGYQKKIMKFQDWQKVEGGQIQVRESKGKADEHGYAVVRPDDDQGHDIFIRVWLGHPNSVIIMPRRDEPLPRQGSEKAEIMEQMELVRPERVDDYVIWLMRMRKVE